VTAQLRLFRQFALQDLGPDASEQDIDCHVGFLLSLTAEQYQDYLICLAIA
jgi:hypothetical protein